MVSLFPLTSLLGMGVSTTSHVMSPAIVRTANLRAGSRESGELRAAMKVMIARWSVFNNDPPSRWYVPCRAQDADYHDVSFVVYVLVKYRFPLARTKMNQYREVVDIGMRLCHHLLGDDGSRRAALGRAVEDWRTYGVRSEKKQKRAEIRKANKVPVPSEVPSASPCHSITSNTKK